MSVCLKVFNDTVGLCPCPFSTKSPLKPRRHPSSKWAASKNGAQKRLQLEFWGARKMLTRLAETTQACFKHFKSKCDSRWLKLHHASWLRPRHFFPSAQAPIPAQTESPVANGGPSRKVRGIAERLSCNQTDKDWRVPCKPAIPRSFAVERVLAADVSNDIEKPSDSPPLCIKWYPILINDIDLRKWSEAHRGAFQANVGFLQANEPQSFFSGSAAPICCRMNLSWRTKHNCTNFFRMMSGQASHLMGCHGFASKCGQEGCAVSWITRNIQQPDMRVCIIVSKQSKWQLPRDCSGVWFSVAYFKATAPRVNWIILRSIWWGLLGKSR